MKFGMEKWFLWTNYRVKTKESNYKWLLLMFFHDLSEFKQWKKMPKRLCQLKKKFVEKTLNAKLKMSNNKHLIDLILNSNRINLNQSEKNHIR